MITWLASYPRSGNTFFRVILNVVFDIKTYSIYNDNDIGSDQKTSDVVGHIVLPDNFDIGNARQSKEVYYIKTHEYYDERVTSEDKVIYLIRDGRESTLSFTKHQNIYGKKNKILLDTIYGDTWIGSWGDHVLSWGKFPQEKILYIHFEALTDHPSEQIGKIADFLGIQALNNRIPTFEELKTTNPKFFRSGKKDSWRDTYTKEEHISFWYKHFEPMKKYGYVDLMPELFNSPDIGSLYRAIETDRIYTKEKALSSAADKYESRIKTLKLVIENLKKELCSETKKIEAVEKKLNTIITELAQLTNIKFSENPIQKYHAYKQMLNTYHTSTKHTYIPKKTLLLPTDNPHTYPDKQFCILESECPILIYQVGKVGSSAIYVSLKEQIKDIPVYQIHNISKAQELLNKDLKQDIKSGVSHFTMGIALKKKITKEPDIRWKIIVGVREPISRWISDVFENIHGRYSFLKNSDNSVNIEKTIQFIKETINEEPQEKWFNDELLVTFGVNLFDKPFTGNYQIDHNEKIEVLVYKFENMQEYMPLIIKEFLNLKDFNLTTANVASQKSTAGEYKEVKKQLKFEVSFLDTFYENPIVSHFYTSKEIEAFKKQWGKSAG